MNQYVFLMNHFGNGKEKLTKTKITLQIEAPLLNNINSSICIYRYTGIFPPVETWLVYTS